MKSAPEPFLRPRVHALAAAMATGLALAGGVAAQSSAPTPAQQQELDAARADLQRAARRVAELSREYHRPGEAPMAFKQAFETRPVLGVLLGPNDAKGVRIVGVTPDSAAAGAGLRSGDVLLGVDGKQILGSDGELRLGNARKLLGKLETGKSVRIGYARGGAEKSVTVTPKPGKRALVWNADDGSAFRMFDGGQFDFDSAEFRKGMDEAMRVVAVEAPRISKEILRLGDCREKDGDCGFPMLTEAFRWSGLNLASLDPQLGRYFGTDQGVLVLSTGSELEGLQAGDVVQKIDGKAVDSPRAAMAALRARPAESRVRVDYLRDRKPGSAQVKVPKATPFRVPRPPAPPAPPAPPPAPLAPDSATAPPVPPAAPPPPDAPRAIERRHVVLVDKDGKRHEWTDAGSAPLPPGSTHIEKRRMVFIDDDGTTTVLEGANAPEPPDPPAPPAPIGD
jgi:membrane-associated protease RseP (regulator of RpoE activity)